MKVSRSRAGRVGRNLPSSRSIYWGLWTPRDLFKSGEQGLWYDPSDLTDAKVTWRRNQLAYSDTAENPVWTKNNMLVTANAATNPEGLTLARKLVADTTTNNHTITQAFQAVTGQAYTITYRLKKAEYGYAFVGINGGGIAYFISVNLTTGALSAALPNGAVTSSSAILSDGWIEVTVQGTASASISMPVDVRSSPDGIWNNRTYTGDGVSGIYFGGAQIDIGAKTPYQRITDPTLDFMAAFPLHTLFQDSAGTTPVTAVEQPVGLVLDKRLGGPGSELLLNGGYSQGLTGWSPSLGTPTIAIESGELKITATAAGSASRASTPVACVIGRVYVVRGYVRRGTTTSTVYLCASANANLTSAVTSVASSSVVPAPASVVFTATATTMYVGFADTSSNAIGVTSYFGPVSVREISASYAVQATTTARPLISARVNKCLNYNANPVDLAGLTFTNATNALATATVVDDTSAIAAAGLSGQATSGKVYRIDNSLGNSSAYLVASGSVGSTSQHTVSAYGRLISGSLVRVELQGGAGGTTSASATYTKISTTVTPDTTARGLVMLVPAGAIGHFILNQLEEGTPSSRVQVTTGSTYDATGWPRYLSFDGVDDNMQISNLDLLRNTPSAFLSLAAYAPPTGASGRIFAAGADRFLFYKGAIDNISMGARGLDADAAVYGGVGAALPVSEQFSLLAAYARGTVQTRRSRGATIANTAMTSAANTSDTASAAIRVGANANGASEFVRGKLYNLLLLCTREPTSAEITKIENAMEARRLAA